MGGILNKNMKVTKLSWFKVKVDVADTRRTAQKCSHCLFLSENSELIGEVG